MKPNNIKSKINTIVGSIGAFIGVFVLIAYIHRLLQTSVDPKVNLGSQLWPLSRV